MTVATSLNIQDQRMIDLVQHLIDAEVIASRTIFFDAIGIRKQGFHAVMSGAQHFTVEQIARACDKYNVNANWIFGLQKNMFRAPAGPQEAEGDENAIVVLKLDKLATELEAIKAQLIRKKVKK